MNKTIFQKDMTGNRMIVTREFAAPVEQVWKAWTDSTLLDQWWAPKPWQAITKTMDFREGGHWLYAMQGPDGTKIWARIDYQTIRVNKSFDAVDSFCDEQGTKNNEFPSMVWKNQFSSTADGAKVVVEISFSSSEDMQKIVEMGFQEGFSAAHDNLDELFAKKLMMA